MSPFVRNVINGYFTQLKKYVTRSLAQVFYFDISGDIVLKHMAGGTMLTKLRKVSYFASHGTVDLDGSHIRMITFF